MTDKAAAQPPPCLLPDAGLEMSEPATDLAVACAIASSYFEQPIARDVAMIGEVRRLPPVAFSQLGVVN